MSWRGVDAVRLRRLAVERIFLEQHLLVAKEIECAIRGWSIELNDAAPIF